MGGEPGLFLAQCNWGIKAYDLKVLLILNPNNKCAWFLCGNSLCWWFTGTRRILWIRGKIASGRSTLGFWKNLWQESSWKTIKTISMGLRKGPFMVWSCLQDKKQKERQNCRFSGWRRVESNISQYPDATLVLFNIFTVTWRGRQTAKSPKYGD